MKKRVVVAMSGGVDSSVAALLLKKSGYEVMGLTICFNLKGSKTKKPRCCTLEGIEDARRVAHKLGLKHYVLNMQKALEDKVIKDFCWEYQKGRTPNPCIRCNQYIKFEALLNKALSLDASFLATGHYARIRRARGAAGRPNEYLLEKAKDRHKDQSYFLYRLNQRQLRQILFPLGNYSKAEVRRIAQKHRLPVAQKAESQEICFLPRGDFRPFLLEKIEGQIKPGAVVDLEGAVLGQHKGIALYTVGQREGLGIAMGYPAYIVRIEARSNRIVLGRREDACERLFLVKEPHFIIKPSKKKIALKVKIRYNHREASAEILLKGKKIRVLCKEPQFAVTPGQSAVFYEKDAVIGGGIIERVLDGDD